MAEVEIDIAGRRHIVACRDGEEEHLRLLARQVSRKAGEVAGAVGGVNETRQILLAALLIADELHDVRAAAASTRLDPPDSQPSTDSPPPDPALAIALERLAERMEAIAGRLEA